MSKYALYHMYDVESNSDSDENEEINCNFININIDDLFYMTEWYKDQHLLFLKIDKCNFDRWLVPQYTPYCPDYIQFTQVFNKETYFAWLKMNNLPVRYKYTGVHWGYKKYNDNELLWMKNFVRHFMDISGVKDKSWIWSCLLESVSY